MHVFFYFFALHTNINNVDSMHLKGKWGRILDAYKQVSVHSAINFVTLKIVSLLLGIKFEFLIPEWIARRMINGK